MVQRISDFGSDWFRAEIIVHRRSSSNIDKRKVNMTKSNQEQLVDSKQKYTLYQNKKLNF